MGAMDVKGHVARWFLLDDGTGCQTSDGRCWWRGDHQHSQWGEIPPPEGYGPSPPPATKVVQIATGPQAHVLYALLSDGCLYRMDPAGPAGGAWVRMTVPNQEEVAP